MMSTSTYPARSGSSRLNVRDASPECSAVRIGQVNTRTSGTRTKPVHTREVGRLAPRTAIGGGRAKTAATYQAISATPSVTQGAAESSRAINQASQATAVQFQAESSAVPLKPRLRRRRTGMRLTIAAPANESVQGLSTS